MIDALFNQPNYLAVKRMMDATALQQRAVASNLAHLETPGYRRIAVAPDFQADLRQALSAKNTHRLMELRPQLQTDPDAIAQRMDGNTVNLETELLEQNKVSLAHALETHLLTGNLLRLRLAITGRS